MKIHTLLYLLFKYVYSQELALVRQPTMLR